MSFSVALLWGASAILLFVVAIYQWLKANPVHAGDWFWMFFLLGLVVAVGLFSPSLFYSDVQSKGANDSAPWFMVGLMYVSMILGIIAQSFYFGGAATPSTSWIKPVLASPIIFIPLLSSYQSSLANIGGVTISDLMILLVSFQNGFFWKVVFDKQAEAIEKQKAAEGLPRV